jgi:hypothetical protein
MLKFSTFVNTFDFALLYVVKVKHISGILRTGGGALVSILSVPSLYFISQNSFSAVLSSVFVAK